MVTCANITLEKIRAKVTFGSLVFETPDIISMGVSKSRSSLPGTFNCSIKVPVNTVFPVNQDIIIEAGTLGNLKRLITASVLSITVNPSFDDASSFVVNMSGSDKFHEINGKNISRRQRTRGATTFAAITSVTKAPQKGVSLELHKQSGGSSKITSRDTNLREHSKLVKTDRVQWDPFNTSKDPEQIDTSNASATAAASLDIKPKTAVLSPGISVLYEVQNVTYAEADTWEVSDTNIGTIVDNKDGTATYTQKALGENTITFTDASGDSFEGKATAVGTNIHDHSSLGAGGPAFAVFGSD